MRLDRNSTGTILLVYAISVAVAAVLFVFVKSAYIVWPSVALLLWFCVWQTCFFRIPHRQAVGNDSGIYSVADGQIVIIEKVFEGEYLKRECIQVSVYMNFFDVHANFWPITGEVTYYRYYPGAHMLAFHPKSSVLNEHTCTAIRNKEGKEIFFKQIAGGFARRIVNYATPGMKIEAGSQCGIIKFGSRIDMFLPPDADIKVSSGDYVRACETLIAKI